MRTQRLISLGIPRGAPLERVRAALPALTSAGYTGRRLRALLAELADDPEAMLEHPQLAEAARALLDARAAGRGARPDQPDSPGQQRRHRGEPDSPRQRGRGRGEPDLRRQAAGARHAPESPAPWQRWGEDIEPGALRQMEDACGLPVSVAGALMPDAHQGYGLPIGGVLATRDAVIPYAVGVDIACRMRLSVLDWPVSALQTRQEALAEALERETRFGVGAAFASAERREHAVMDEDWRMAPVVAGLKDLAWAQLGTSGGGNHFAEFGVLAVYGDLAPADRLVLPPGKYLALLTHSGSRGPGARIAEHYSRVAARLHPELQGRLGRLAWLELGREEGQAYWAAMELMGRYAAANHELIHHHVMDRLGAAVRLVVENHHNFAWIEKHQGTRVVVHRKGATPAGRGVLGVIPGSMASPAYVVRGLGAPDALCSAAHGAGRRMSRAEAKRRFRWPEARALLAERRVRLLSGGLDEVPMAYKDIDAVMTAQQDLVRPVARFEPRLVKMAPPEGRRRR